MNTIFVITSLCLNSKKIHILLCSQQWGTWCTQPIVTHVEYCLMVNSHNLWTVKTFKDWRSCGLKEGFEARCVLHVNSKGHLQEIMCVSNRCLSEICYLLGDKDIPGLCISISAASGCLPWDPESILTGLHLPVALHESNFPFSSPDHLSTVLVTVTVYFTGLVIMQLTSKLRYYETQWTTFPKEYHTFWVLSSLDTPPITMAEDLSVAVSNFPRLFFPWSPLLSYGRRPRLHFLE